MGIAILTVIRIRTLAATTEIRGYLKNNLSAHGGVAKRLKMLTYDVYAPLFRHFAPYVRLKATPHKCHEP
jgi:O-glycosyl hydrolase